MDNLAHEIPQVVERIEGKTYLMSPRPLVRHNMVSSNIFHIFANYLHGKPCMAFADGMDVHLDEENLYVPNALIVCDQSKVHRDGIYGAPDLVVEVLSPSNMKKDRGAKMKHYAASGVREYWMVAPLGKSVEVYLNRDGTFELDEIYTDYDPRDLARMNAQEQQEVKTWIPVSIDIDFQVSVKEIFEDIDEFG